MIRKIWADENGPHSPAQYPDGVFELRMVRSDYDGDLYLRVCQLPTSGIWVFAFPDYYSANMCPLMPLEANINKPNLLGYVQDIAPMPPGTPEGNSASFALIPSPAFPQLPLTEIGFYALGISKTENPDYAWHMVWAGLIPLAASF